jgi:hypothetical protein
MVFTEQDELIVITTIRLWSENLFRSIRTVRKNYISPLSECFFSPFSHRFLTNFPTFVV